MHTKSLCIEPLKLLVSQSPYCLADYNSTVQEFTAKRVNYRVYTTGDALGSSGHLGQFFKLHCEYPLFFLDRRGLDFPATAM